MDYPVGPFVRNTKSWDFDDSAKHPTDKERIEQLEDEVKRERAACEYWRLLYEGVKK